LKPIAKTTLFYACAAALPFGVYFVPGLGTDFEIGPDTLSGLSKAPWVALAVLGFLGWRLNQTRILFSALLLLAAFGQLSLPGRQLLGLQGDPLAYSISLALPLGLCLAYSFREAPLFSQRSLGRLALVVLPLLLAAGLAAADPFAFFRLASWGAFPGQGFRLPLAALAALLIFIAMAALSRDLKVKPFMQALAFALLPVLLALESALSRSANFPQHHASIVVLAFLCSSAILLWAIFSMYWQRVYLDELTGIPNRRALDEKLLSLDSGYALAMVDIDHFKKFNDNYGHDEGDNVLKLVSRHLSDGSGGKAYRYGGEEFCMIFEGWSSEIAAGHSDGIREALANRQFKIRLPEVIRKKTSAKDRGTLRAKSLPVKVTISIGVAAPDKEHAKAGDVIKLADQALYAAKEKGRNCVVRKN
jgi:diguanylate cyclase (GGDEF)-like protein